jgi:ankyrin repeat protein
VRELLARGADVEVVHLEYDATPLFRAATYGHLEIARELLAHGANVDPKSRGYGETPLFEAARGGNLDFVRELLAHGADVNAKTNNRKTALILASQEGHTETVRLLLQSGADVDAKDDEGTTALMYASQEGHTETVRLLLEYGAEINKNAINKANNNIKPILTAWVRGKHLNRAATVLKKLNNTNLPRLPSELKGKVGEFFSGTNGKKGVQYGPIMPGVEANYLGNQKRELQGIIGGTRKRRSRKSRKSRKRSK